MPGRQKGFSIFIVQVYKFNEVGAVWKLFLKLMIMKIKSHIEEKNIKTKEEKRKDRRFKEYKSINS